MVPRCGEGVAYAFEDAFLVMFYGAGFAVHEPFGMDDFAAVSVDYSLMPKQTPKVGMVWLMVCRIFVQTPKYLFIFRGCLVQAKSRFGQA